MSLPWHKAPNAEILAGMGAHDWPKGYRLPDYVCRIEARAVLHGDTSRQWSLKRLAERWGRSKSAAYRIMSAIKQEAEEAVGKSGTMPERDRNDGGTDAERPMPSWRPSWRAGGTMPERDRNDAGTMPEPLARARSIPEKNKKEKEIETPSPTPPPNGEWRPIITNRKPEPDYPMRWREVWDAYAEERYPGQRGQLWDEGRPMISPREAMRQEHLWEHGQWLPRMLELYITACRAGKRTFAQKDFATPQIATALRDWAEHGVAPWWAKGMEATPLAEAPRQDSPALVEEF